MIKKTIVTKTLVFDLDCVLDTLLAYLPNEEEYVKIDNKDVTISVDKKNVILTIKQEE